MTTADDHEYLDRLKDRIERHNRQEREAIARGRMEREKCLNEKGGVADRNVLTRDASAAGEPVSGSAPVIS